MAKTRNVAPESEKPTTTPSKGVSAGSGADGNANGTIDEGDYTYWRARYGNVIAGAGISVNVPEPSTPANVLLVIVGVGCQRSTLTKRGCRESQAPKEM